MQIVKKIKKLSELISPPTSHMKSFLLSHDNCFKLWKMYKVTNRKHISVE